MLLQLVNYLFPPAWQLHETLHPTFQVLTKGEWLESEFLIKHFHYDEKVHIIWVKFSAIIKKRTFNMTIIWRTIWRTTRRAPWEQRWGHLRGYSRGHKDMCVTAHIVIIIFRICVILARNPRVVLSDIAPVNYVWNILNTSFPDFLGSIGDPAKTLTFTTTPVLGRE